MTTKAIKASGIEAGQRQLNGVQTTGREFRNLSQPTYDMVQTNNVAVPMRDHIELLADLYLPDDAGQFPALLAFSPYPRQIQNTRLPMGFVEAGASDFFVPRGYAHVIANARSTGGSGGTWGLLDQTERDDLYDLIEWVAAQPWCDGNVGMVGISYFAMAQIAAAVTRPPSLKAIFPLGTNESVFDVAWHHGLCASSFLSPWIASVGGLGVKDDKVWRGKVLDLVTRTASERHVHERLAHVNGEAITGILKNVIRTKVPDEPFARLWQETAVEHPTYDDFWADRDSLAALAHVDIPVYLGCDWDNVIMHLPGTFTSWKALAHNPNVRMSLLPNGGLNWPWESMHIEVLAWFDHWFKGADTGITDGPPIRYYLPEADQWRTADQWPPRESSLVEYALRTDGVLDVDEGETGTRQYLHLAPESGRPEHASPPQLPDSLTWDTPAATEDLDIAGAVELRLEAAITALDCAWIAVLYDVAPDGSQTPVTGGWLRGMLRKVNEDASTPGAPVVECREPEAIAVGEVTTYRIPIVPIARRIQPGHQLRLVVTSSDQGKDAPTILGFRHTPLGDSSLNTIHSSSRLLLPVLGHDA
jgi:putative CocE/NonD family hydrolase